MKVFEVRPVIERYETAEEFAREIHLGEGDLVIAGRHTYKKYIEPLNTGCEVLLAGNYGKGEPTDVMVEKMAADIKGTHTRVVAIGGGTVLDVAKLFALKEMIPVTGLFDGKTEPVRDKELILVPTTCGTGSEVTNISILALTTQGTKKGLAHDALYADTAVLVPELLSDIPFSVFATSSIDALVHAVESALSPKGNDITRMFSYRAAGEILTGYQTIVEKGKEVLPQLLGDFLEASNYAGIAFGNAGCAAVHALSYPLGATYHVAHGESNYAMFTGVMKKYMEIRADGEIDRMNGFLADILSCEKTEVYDRLEELLDHLIPKKPLCRYGMKEEEIETFADSVLANQTRLLANNFVPLDRGQIIDIYRSLYEER